MKTIGVVGAGTMGAGIAQSAASSGFDVFLFDVSEEGLKKALLRISNILSKSVEKNVITSQQAESSLSRIHTKTSLQSFSSCDIVIEAAVEDIKAKHNIFQELENICKTDTILATNTSSLSVTAIASSVKNPERVIGMHFFNPAHTMKLVEVIRAHKTSDQTIHQTIELAKQMGKVPIVAKDTPGFIVNRIARSFYGEALRLLGEGVSTVEEIDRIVKLEGGFKMGPFELMDLIGIDINLTVTKSVYEQTFGEPRYRPHIIQQQMVDAGQLGRKTKRGFYSYEK